MSGITINQRKKGIILVLLSAIFWGVAGTLAQYLFQVKSFNIEWLVVLRLLSAGLLLLLFNYSKEKERIWSIWKNKHDVANLLLYSFLGMLAVQYILNGYIQIKEKSDKSIRIPHSFLNYDIQTKLLKLNYVG